jgi:hypothetical protein
LTYFGVFFEFPERKKLHEHQKMAKDDPFVSDTAKVSDKVSEHLIVFVDSKR